MSEPTGSTPKAGDVLDGKYVLREPIGEGGMGSVFLADQPALARTVAIKILQPWLASNRELADRFYDEAIAASRVHHPCSIVIFDCNRLRDGTPYIVMQHVRGRSLGRIIGDEAIPLPRAIGLVLQILSALDAAHCSGVVHADIKSDNFLVEDIDGADHVTMIDFGLARVDGRSNWLDEEGGEPIVSGTPEYMAPEVAGGEPPTPRADIYAVGVILYELLTRATPFGGGTAAEIMVRHLEDVVIPPSIRAPGRQLPAPLDEVVLRALAKQPEDRFADANAFARALREVMHARQPATPGSAPWRAEAASPDSTTLTCRAPVTGRRIARGSDCSAGGQGERLAEARHAIGEALTRGDVVGIANGYMDLASTLARAERLTDAARELEQGIDVLSAGRGPTAPGVPKLVGRLALALAAIYEEIGERHQARRIAASADSHPTLIDVAVPPAWTGCTRSRVSAARDPSRGPT